MENNSNNKNIDDERPDNIAFDISLDGDNKGNNDGEVSNEVSEEGNNNTNELSNEVSNEMSNEVNNNNGEENNNMENFDLNLFTLNIVKHRDPYEQNNNSSGEKYDKNIDNALKEEEQAKENYTRHYESVLYQLSEEQEQERLRKSLKEDYNPVIIIKDELEAFFNSKLMIYTLVIIIIVLLYLWYNGFFEDVMPKKHKKKKHHKLKHYMSNQNYDKFKYNDSRLVDSQLDNSQLIDYNFIKVV